MRAADGSDVREAGAEVFCAVTCNTHEIPPVDEIFHDISAGIWRDMGDMGDTGDIARYNEILARF